MSTQNNIDSMIRHSGRILINGFIFCVSLFLLGCTHIAEVRTKHFADTATLPAPDIESAKFITDLDNLGTGSKTDDAHKYSVEKLISKNGESAIAFVEFDDQGWLYPNTDISNQNDQIDAVSDLVESSLIDAQKSSSKLLVLVFVHGWHHNAQEDDRNLKEFRYMVEKAQAIINPHPKDSCKGKVVGIYVGWRGESVDKMGLRYTTILDRRNSAEHVAKGSVRELFANLQSIETLDSKGAMRTVVMGHSFGGLIAYNGLSQTVLTGLLLDPPVKASNKGGGSVVTSFRGNINPRKPNSFWPDQLILINPAFEASRFEILKNAVFRSNRGDYSAFIKRTPRVISITATTDWATGPVFTVFRNVATIFEGYEDTVEDNVAYAIRRSEEKKANKHSVGFTERYITHDLELVSDKYIKVNHVSTPTNEESNPYSAHVAELYLSQAGDNSPVWVVRAPSNIIDGHDGFLFSKNRKDGISLKPYLVNWIICMNVDGVDMEHIEKCQEDAVALEPNMSNSVKNLLN